MRIRVAFVDYDDNYLQKVKNKIRKDYTAELEGAYYSGLSEFIADFKNNKVNVAVINASFANDEDFVRIPCHAVLSLLEF